MLEVANFDAGPADGIFEAAAAWLPDRAPPFPDLPSNRYAEIATRVRALCDKFDLPYTTGSLLGQYLQTVRTIHKLALPNRFLKDECRQSELDDRTGPVCLPLRGNNSSMQSMGRSR